MKEVCGSFFDVIFNLGLRIGLPPPHGGPRRRLKAEHRQDEEGIRRRSGACNVYVCGLYCRFDGPESEEGCVITSTPRQGRDRRQRNGG